MESSFDFQMIKSTVENLNKIVSAYRIMWAFAEGLIVEQFSMIIPLPDYFWPPLKGIKTVIH